MRIKLVEVEEGKFHVLFDGAAIGTLIRRPQTNTGFTCPPRWVAFGPGKPDDFASRVAAIRYLVHADAEFKMQRAA